MFGGDGEAFGVAEGEGVVEGGGVLEVDAASGGVFAGAGIEEVEGVIGLIKISIRGGLRGCGGKYSKRDVVEK